MNILVTGGAGYIGSIMTHLLVQEGMNVIVLDNVSNGHAKNVDAKALFIKKSITKDVLDKLFTTYKIDAVMHFAGVISAGESMENPIKYFRENTANTITLLSSMKKHNVRYIVFSSTAALYGNPKTIPIPETHPLVPTNVYGESKLMIEQVLKHMSLSQDIRYASLRYFNASGALVKYGLGELHKDETHLIPRALYAAVHGIKFDLYGTDYDTKDGTCIRDYIHVRDLCSAHIYALKKICTEDTNCIYNVGTGKGYSNKEVLSAIERIVGKKITIHAAPRRKGDPKVLIADPFKIMKELSWKPKYSELEIIIESAWNFHKKYGFGKIQ